MFIDVARSVVDPSRPFFLWQLHWPSSSNRRAAKGSALASLQGSFCLVAELQIESRPEKFYKIIGNFPWRRRQNERLTENPVFRELRSRFWHTGGMYPNCDTFAERLKDGRTTDYRRGKGNLVLVYGDRDG
jgi:hypothetical protein